MVEGLVRLAGAERDAANEGPVNLGNPREMTVAEIAASILEATGSASRIDHVPRPPQDPSRRRPDITRAKEILGWTPRVELRAGLRATVDWARSVLGGEVGSPR
jgi:UDP-glucuronate decarboxylase